MILYPRNRPFYPTFNYCTFAIPLLIHVPSISQLTATGIVLRLVGMASDRLRRALRAVPDDIKTRHALADAYQVRTVS